jgi:hypothetical protein
MVVPEAPVERTETGLAPVGEGWLVLKAREACWLHRESWSASCEFEGETEFPALSWPSARVSTRAGFPDSEVL